MAVPVSKLRAASRRMPLAAGRFWQSLTSSRLSAGLATTRPLAQVGAGGGEGGGLVVAGSGVGVGREGGAITGLQATDSSDA